MGRPAINDPVLDELLRALVVFEKYKVLAYGELTRKRNKIAEHCGVSERKAYYRYKEIKTGRPPKLDLKGMIG